MLDEQRRQADSASNSARQQDHAESLRMQLEREVCGRGVQVVAWVQDRRFRSVLHMLVPVNCCVLCQCLSW